MGTFTDRVSPPVLLPGDGKHALGDFLRSRRARLSPEAVGIADKRWRRTPGLKREEVAELAGIGVDWYTRLEQGRAGKPSAATIATLAAALRMTRAEHDHLLALCSSLRQPLFERETVSEALDRVVAALEQPAYVTGLRWDVLAWNAAADELFGFGQLPEEDRNILVFALTNPAAQRLFDSNWANEARRVLAKFRATYDLWSSDPAFVSLIARLGRDCPHFSAWWEAHDVRAAAGSRKMLHGPGKSPTRFDFTTFQVNDSPALQLVVLVPA